MSTYDPVALVCDAIASDPNVHPAMRRAFMRAKPGAVEVSIGYVDPNDADLLCWTRVEMTRGEAARTLRSARHRLLTIEKSRTGWCISGDLCPGWEY
jgi:hypothetical protein